MINKHDIVIEALSGLDHADYPDYVDAFITSAFFKSTGIHLTDRDLDLINEDTEFLHNVIWDYIY